MKKKIILLLSLCLTITTVSGCSLKTKEEETSVLSPTTLVDNTTGTTTTQAVPETSGETAPAAVAPSETTSKNTDTVYKAKLGLSDSEVSKLSNKRQDSYFGGDVNAQNVPVACLNFQQQYGKYNADFIRN